MMKPKHMGFGVPVAPQEYHRTEQPSAAQRKRAAYAAAERELQRAVDEASATVGSVGMTARELIDAMLARGFKITYAGERL